MTLNNRFGTFQLFFYRLTLKRQCFEFHFNLTPKSLAQRAVDGKKGDRGTMKVRAVETRVSGYVLFNTPISPLP
ncbi:TPA: hypothetical protein RG501_RS20720 [Providencia rettgeri]|uniref:hypothetical protein n=1 Tax=Providencia rettgeri TaxID=587 RepID=UPI0011411039|nr:hypothetical protein [Providencia rettgeri]HEC8326262.1 hypothetical protein [Providencia rettgeri]